MLLVKAYGSLWNKQFTNVIPKLKGLFRRDDIRALIQYKDVVLPV